jgi:hypothetical protein
MARYILIQEGMGPAAGDFARTSQNFAGSLKTLQAVVANTAADFGNLFIPAATEAVHRLTDLALKVQSLTPEMKRLVAIVGVVAAAIGPALIAFGAFMSILSKVGAAAALLTGPLGLIVAAVAGLYIAWRNNWFNIQGIVETVVGNLQEIFDKLIQFFEHGVDKGFDPFKAALRALIRIVQEPLGEDSPVVRALQGILRNGEKLGDWINKDFIPTLANALRALTSGDWSTAGRIFESVGKDIKGGWDRTIGPFLADLANLAEDVLGGVIAGIKQQDWDQIGDQLGTAIQAGLTKLSEFGSWVLDAIRGVGSGGGASGSGVVKAQQIGTELTGFLSDRFKEVDWPKLADDLISGATRAVALFLDFQKWRFEKILQIGQFIADRIAEVKWDEVGTKLLDLWRPVWDTFMEGVRTQGAAIAQSVLDGIKEAPWDKVGQQVNDSIQGVLAVLNQLGTWIKDQIAGINWDDVGSFLVDKEEGAINAFIEGVKRSLMALRDFALWVGDELNKTQFSALQDTINKKGAEFFGSFVSGVKSKLVDLQNFIQGISDDAQRWLQNASNILLTRGQELIDGLRHGAQDFWNNKAGVFFTSIPSLITNAIGSLAKLLIDKGSEIIDGIRHGAQDYWNNTLGPWVQKIPGMIKDAVAGAVFAALEGLKQSGKDLVDAIWKGIQEQFTVLNANVQKAIDDIPRPTADFLNPGSGQDNGVVGSPDGPGVIPQSDPGAVKRKFVPLGEAANAGIQEGLDNTTTDVTQTQEDQIQAQYDAAAAKLEAKSPSQLFARLGVFTGEGYIQGLQSMLGKVEDVGSHLGEVANTGLLTVLTKIRLAAEETAKTVATQLGQTANTLGVSAAAAVHAQETSDAARVDSAKTTTDRMSTEELTRASIAANAGKQTAEDTKAQQEKRLQAEHDYARASIDNEKSRVKSIRDANVELDHTLHDLTIKRAQTERTLNKELAAIESDRVETAKQFESQLTDIAQQRNDIETQAAQQKADIEKNLQDQLSQAEAQFNETQQQNLEQQSQIREELANQLKEAAAAWKEADAAAVEAINKIKDSLKETLASGREEFNRLMRDMDTDSSRTEEDFQRNLEDLGIERSRVQADLQATLGDPNISLQQKAQARIDAARALQDLDRRQQDLEIQHQRAVEDAETARHDAELQHREEEKAAREAAHQQILDQKKTEKDAEQAYHDKRVSLEEDAAKQIGQLQSDLGTAASDLRTTQAGLRDDALKQIDDVATQEKASLDDIAKQEQGIYDERFKAFQDLEDRKTAAFRTAEQDRTTIARDEQKARDLDARTQNQAEQDAARAQRKALRQLHSAEDETDKTLAEQRGEAFGTQQGKGVATGLEATQNNTQQAGEKLSTATETGYTSASDSGDLGTQWANDLINGILSRLGGARSAGNQLATAAEDGFRDASEMSSPSRVALGLGALYGKSVGLGILSQRKFIADSISGSVSAQGIVSSGIAAQTVSDQGRAVSSLPGVSQGPLVATVVIQDAQMRSFILGTAIAPMVGSRDRVSAAGIF